MSYKPPHVVEGFFEQRLPSCGVVLVEAAATWATTVSLYSSPNKLAITKTGGVWMVRP